MQMPYDVAKAAIDDSHQPSGVRRHLASERHQATPTAVKLRVAMEAQKAYLVDSDMTHRSLTRRVRHLI